MLSPMNFVKCNWRPVCYVTDSLQFITLLNFVTFSKKDTSPNAK